jgi:hypothetical protein
MLCVYTQAWASDPNLAVTLRRPSGAAKTAQRAERSAEIAAGLLLQFHANVIVLAMHLFFLVGSFPS